jgi:hypothetical protein
LSFLRCLVWHGLLLLTIKMRSFFILIVKRRGREIWIIAETEVVNLRAVDTLLK